MGMFDAVLATNEQMQMRNCPAEPGLRSPSSPSSPSKHLKASSASHGSGQTIAVLWAET